MDARETDHGDARTEDFEAHDDQRRRRGRLGVCRSCFLDRGRSAREIVHIDSAPGQGDVDRPPYSDTPVWAFNGQVPGPEIRVRQNDRVKVTVVNGLPQDTTVHWHGLRVPNAMDGVPHLTQDPVPPGGTFVYEFSVPDAGTYWYHPHERSFEQVGRGLSGAFVVEEAEPIRVDRDLVWVLDDWRLTSAAALTEDFGNPMDVNMAGRIGNTVTINGRVPESIPVRSGERLRLRLVNVANARMFALDFDGHHPQVIALDGQPIEPHAPPAGLILLAPGQRADIIIDAVGRPGERFTVSDRFYDRQHYRLVDFQYATTAPVRESPLDAPIRLPRNHLAEPDLATAIRQPIALGGGMMGMGMMGGGGMMGRMGGGGMMGMVGRMGTGEVWLINGVSMVHETRVPLFTMEHGRTYIFEMANLTAFAHPMHLHGHAFRVMTRNGLVVAPAEWRDTVLVAPQERVEIAFVADNPGDWMFHCHILEHQLGGMMSDVRVA